MDVEITFRPADKSALRQVLSNIPLIVRNIDGEFNCTIKITAHFKGQK